MKHLKIHNVIDLELDDLLADEVIKNVKSSHGEISYIEFVLKSHEPSVIDNSFHVKGRNCIDGVGQIEKVELLNATKTIWKKDNEYEEDEYEF